MRVDVRFKVREREREGDALMFFLKVRFGSVEILRKRVYEAVAIDENIRVEEANDVWSTHVCSS